MTYCPSQMVLYKLSILKGQSSYTLIIYQLNCSIATFSDNSSRNAIRWWKVHQCCCNHQYSCNHLMSSFFLCIYVYGIVFSLDIPRSNFILAYNAFANFNFASIIVICHFISFLIKHKPLHFSLHFLFQFLLVHNASQLLL